MYEVKVGTWEEFAEGGLVKRVATEIDPKTLLIALGEMTTANWADYEFYEPQEYKELLQEFEKTGNWDWIRELERFKEALRCAEEPIGYIVFWKGDEVVDVVVLVLFHEEHYVNLLIYRLGGG
jgi:hypothetical protein